jgi:hypothetical protein
MTRAPALLMRKTPFKSTLSNRSLVLTETLWSSLIELTRDSVTRLLRQRAKPAQKTRNPEMKLRDLTVF